MIEEMIEGLKEVRISNPSLTILQLKIIDKTTSYLTAVKDVGEVRKIYRSENGKSHEHNRGFNQAVDLCNFKIAGVVAEHLKLYKDNIKLGNDVIELEEDNAKLKKEVDTRTAVMTNDCENEEEARKIASQVLTEFELNGDSYATHGIVEQVEYLVIKIKVLKKEVEELQSCNNGSPITNKGRYITQEEG